MKEPISVGTWDGGLIAHSLEDLGISIVATFKFKWGGSTWQSELVDKTWWEEKEGFWSPFIEPRESKGDI